MPENTPLAHSIGEREAPLPTPSKWWQWIIVYPTLAGSLFTAIPSWIDHIHAKQLGISPDHLDIATEQKGLWEVNFDCTRTLQFKHIPVEGVEVGALVCPTGDILLHVKHPTKEAFRWLGFKTFVIKSGLSFVENAVASDNFPGTLLAQAVVCQRWLQQGILLRRISNGPMGCVDVVINTYTGAVLSQRPVPCVPQC